METIAEFNDNHGFNVKLTSEKIFIDAAGTSETIALRGLNGVGLYDDLEKYNRELESMKSEAKLGVYLKWFFYIMGFIYIILAINNESTGAGVTGIVIIGITYWISNRKKSKDPVLDSYFRLMLSGGDRKFKFNKSDETSVKIADFINKVEDTLTAYK